MQKQAGMVMSKWLSQRNITSSLLSELIKNARECGWHRPLVSHHRLSNSNSLGKLRHHGSQFHGISQRARHTNGSVSALQHRTTCCVVLQAA